MVHLRISLYEIRLVNHTWPFRLPHDTWTLITLKGQSMPMNLQWDVLYKQYTWVYLCYKCSNRIQLYMIFLSTFYVNWHNLSLDMTSWWLPGDPPFSVCPKTPSFGLCPHRRPPPLFCWCARAHPSVYFPSTPPPPLGWNNLGIVWTYLNLTTKSDVWSTWNGNNNDQIFYFPGLFTRCVMWMLFLGSFQTVWWCPFVKGAMLCINTDCIWNCY